MVFATKRAPQPIYMKKLISLAVALLWCGYSVAQEGGDVLISFRSEFGKLERETTKGIRLTAEFFVSDELSLLYNFGYRAHGGLDIGHAPMGVTGGIYLLAASANADDADDDCECETICETDEYGNETCYEDCVDGSGALGVLALLAAAVPEGVAFHFRPNEIMRVSPYVNLLGFDFKKATEDDPRGVLYSASIGSAVSMTFGRLSLHGYAEFRFGANLGYVYGAGVGFILD